MKFEEALHLVEEALREYVGDGEGEDVMVLDVVRNHYLSQGWYTAAHTTERVLHADGYLETAYYYLIENTYESAMADREGDNV